MHDWQEIRVKHGRLVWKTACRILADENDAMDCYQDVFLEAFQRVGENPVQNWPGLLRWLATRRAIDRLRRRRREEQQTVRADGSSALAESGVNPSSSLEMEDVVKTIGTGRCGRNDRDGPDLLASHGRNESAGTSRHERSA